MKKLIALSIGVLASGLQLAAQGQITPTQATPAQQIDRMKGVIEQRATVESRIAKDRPYSATAITESVQVLADGNRIVRKTVVNIARDSDGRTRRETLDANGQVTNITISDPVAGVSYVLNPQTKTASQNNVLMTVGRGGDGGMVTFASADEAKRVLETRQQAETAVARGGGAGGGARGAAPTTVTPVMTAGGFGGRGGGGGSESQINREDLGQKTIEGLLVTGSRTTTTIPAGAIGNEQPIKSVNETWMSADLGVLVLTKSSDPRSGENTYRLANVSRAEPPRTLFDVPADYTIRESRIRQEAPQK
jgi:hypothetical protein